jgi:ATP-dependent RNA helicase DDX5/DBP2
MERAAAEENFVPLRKKLRSKTTGKEHNFAISYYDEEGAAFAVPPNEVAQLRIDYNIEVEGEKVPAPVTKFSEVGLPSEILSKLQLLGCIDPTPIQMQSIPCAMHGRDIVACAETGSGKTLAYILPLFMLLHKLPFTNPGTL